MKRLMEPRCSYAGAVTKLIGHVTVVFTTCHLHSRQQSGFRAVVQQ
jgi:hypothetical protein